MRMTGDLPAPATWFTAVGFGNDAFAGQPGTKRKVAAWVSRTADRYFRAKARSSTETGAGPATACSGDSGSPAIDTEGRIFGVLSKGPHECEADGVRVHARLGGVGRDARADQRVESVSLNAAASMRCSRRTR